ncbi:MAG: 2-oxo acid dehydrogenase subunit E2 [Candidatus Tectimicrobiota bacterium]
MPESIPVLIPQENVNDESVTLVAWHVANGAQVQEGQELAEVEGSKAVFAIPAPAAGTVQYTLEIGQEIAVGAPLCTIISAAPAPVAHNGAAHTPDTVQQPSPAPSQTLASADHLPTCTPETQCTSPRFSRQAAALLQQHGLAPQRFRGYGLVRSADVLTAIAGNGIAQSPLLQTPAVEPPPLHAPEAPPSAAGVPFRREVLSRSKRTEIRYLVSGARHTLPSVVTVAVPTRGLRAAAAQGAHPSGMTSAIILFEVARLLQLYPRFNAFYADGTANLYEAINIGFAIDAGNGLKVPVIRQANMKSLPEISSEMQELLRRYLSATLHVDDLAAGTFTITDLSSEGVLLFHPLINQGQAAILGIGSEYTSGPGPGMGFFTLTLSFDHQLNEGRQAAQFLQELARRLQAYEAALQTQVAEHTTAPHCVRCQMSLSRLRQLDHGQRGRQFLVQTLQPDGTQAYLCSQCMQGW